MGLDMTYQAIPAGCDLIERVRNDPALGEMLCMVPYWLREVGDPRPGSWPESESFRQHVLELAEQYPSLKHAHFELNHSWDELHYLLSATRRGEQETEEDLLLDKAVRCIGGELADHVMSGLGIHVRFVTPGEVERIGLVFEPMTMESLRAHYSPVKMEEQRVYKFWADRAGEFETSAARYFDGFRIFYLDAARRGDGVIVCTD